MERLEFDLFFRWFVVLAIDEAAFDASSFFQKRRPLADARDLCKLLDAARHS